MKPTLPHLRVRRRNSRELRSGARCVVYWMISNRRSRFNFALERAADWARHLGLPLVVLEALRVDYPWASARLHRFVLDGMADNAAAFGRSGVAYVPYVEPESGAGTGLLEALADEAAIVITDDYPTFFLPKMVDSVARRLEVPLESVDSNGLIPLAATEKEFSTAYAFRRWIQKNLHAHLGDLPLEDPLAEPMPPRWSIPAAIFERWPAAPQELLDRDSKALAAYPVDPLPGPTALAGGEVHAQHMLQVFLDETLADYAEKRNRPDDGRTSGLSPFLHFGHISVHEIFLETMRRQRWSPDDVVPPANGRRSGWWGVSETTEAFLDQVVTWRELGYQFCHHRDDHQRWESLPDWARGTLEEHATDPRDHVYDLDAFASAATHDPLWNAAQTQLVREGTIHNYLRMLWGKKILEWTEHPRHALEIMIELNNRFALDGRDPNSVSGIFWVLGRHDRPWGPERPIFGKVRYMTSANTARKVPVKAYLERYSSGGGPS